MAAVARVRMMMATRTRDRLMSVSILVIFSAASKGFWLGSGADHALGHLGKFHEFTRSAAVADMMVEDTATRQSAAPGGRAAAWARFALPILARALEGSGATVSAGAGSPFITQSLQACPAPKEVFIRIDGAKFHMDLALWGQPRTGWVSHDAVRR